MVEKISTNDWMWTQGLLIPKPTADIFMGIHCKLGNMPFVFQLGLGSWWIGIMTLVIRGSHFSLPSTCHQNWAWCIIKHIGPHTHPPLKSIGTWPPEQITLSGANRTSNLAFCKLWLAKFQMTLTVNYTPLPPYAGWLPPTCDMFHPFLFFPQILLFSNW